MARRQEQEEARTEVTEVAPNVLRMQLPIRMPGLGHVNMYALLDADGATVVDPGLPGPGTWKAIQHRLKQADLVVGDVHTVVVTHSHPDHFGGAARFAKESGARIIAHHGFVFGPVQATEHDADVSVEDRSAAAHGPTNGDEEPTASADARDPVEPRLPSSWNTTAPWGGRSPRPPLKTRMRWKLLRWLGRSSFLPVISHPVEHGDVLDLAGREWFVMHTPGHTSDHICLHDPETGVFLAGDHVLPTITPHISGLGTSQDPLQSFFYSLDRVGEIQGVKLALPAHGHPFDDLKARTDAIKRHHFERLERVKEIARELGPASVAAFSERLFKPRAWGPMAESETYAHLEHLRHAREAECQADDGGELIYTLG
jgi:glyoxylase-like metal-dependent hydrolase (beta-lactamase superfamily II)